MLDLDDRNFRELVCKACKKCKVDCDLVPRTFFTQLFSQYKGENDLTEFAKWLDEILPQVFPVVTERPFWIQNYDWPFLNERPMIFLGQIEIDKNGVTKMHDTTIFYLFIPATPWTDSDIKVVVQQY